MSRRSPGVSPSSRAACHLSGSIKPHSAISPVSITPCALPSLRSPSRVALCHVSGLHHAWRSSTSLISITPCALPSLRSPTSHVSLLSLHQSVNLVISLVINGPTCLSGLRKVVRPRSLSVKLCAPAIFSPLFFLSRCYWRLCRSLWEIQETMRFVEKLAPFYLLFEFKLSCFFMYFSKYLLVQSRLASRFLCLNSHPLVKKHVVTLFWEGLLMATTYKSK